MHNTLTVFLQTSSNNGFSSLFLLIFLIVIVVFIMKKSKKNNQSIQFENQPNSQIYSKPTENSFENKKYDELKNYYFPITDIIGQGSITRFVYRGNVKVYI